jgi:hypothetical protein
MAKMCCLPVLPRDRIIYDGHVRFIMTVFDKNTPVIQEANKRLIIRGEGGTEAGWGYVMLGETEAGWRWVRLGEAGWGWVRLGEDENGGWVMLGEDENGGWLSEGVG